MIEAQNKKNMKSMKNKSKKKKTHIVPIYIQPL